MTSEMTQKFAPFTTDEVNSMNEYQKTGAFHPFTCGNRDDGNHNWNPDLGTLVATPGGWVCSDCSYTQLWAHEWMTDWSWKNFSWGDLGGNDV